MFVFIALDAEGRVLAVTRTLEGIAHHAASHALDPLVNGTALTMDALKSAMQTTGCAEVAYGDATPSIRIEHHAITI